MPDQNEEKNPQIEFVFEYAPDHRLVPANGAWGGMTPRGDVRIDFFVESQAIPERIVNEIDVKANAIGKEIKLFPEKHFIRQIQVSVLMNPSALESLGLWVQERLEQLKALAKDNNVSVDTVLPDEKKSEES